MNVVIVLLIALLLALWFTLVIIAIYHEIAVFKETKAKKKDDEFNDQMIYMCIRCKSAGTCPMCCEKCAWGRRMKDGIIELRGSL